MSNGRQHMVTHSSLLGFTREVNRFLAVGWRIVPGSIYSSSMKAAPGPNTPPEQVTTIGVRYAFTYFCVLEHHDADAIPLAPVAH
jgi:hypothetical protein